MADRYTSQIALVLREQVADVGEVVKAAITQGDIDRAAPLRDGAAEGQEVHWGGRMQKAIVRRVDDAVDGLPLLRTETYLGSDGVKAGMQRQAQLVQALSRQVRGNVVGVRDLSAVVERDEAWMNRLAIGSVAPEDAIVAQADGDGTWWVRTHGSARFDVPDLELYGLSRGQTEGAITALRHIHDQLFARGLKADLALADGTPVYVVPVTEAWQHLDLDWPGIGRAGRDRGPGLDGPRATLSVLHKPRFGRYRTDFKGVLQHL